MTECKFHVGDIVRIVDSPVDCVFTWVSGMTRFCGREAEIINVRWVDTKSSWAIYLNISEHFMWDENCIIQVENEVDIDPISSDALLDFM